MLKKFVIFDLIKSKIRIFTFRQIKDKAVFIFGLGSNLSTSTRDRIARKDFDISIQSRMFEHMLWQNIRSEEKIIVGRTGREDYFYPLPFLTNRNIFVDIECLQIPEILLDYGVIGKEQIIYRSIHAIASLLFRLLRQRNIIGLIILRRDFTVFSLETFGIERMIVNARIKQKRLIKETLSVILEIRKIRNLIKNRFHKSSSLF